MNGDNLRKQDGKRSKWRLARKTQAGVQQKENKSREEGRSGGVN